MKLVPAKCPSCGANIKVDRSLKFTKCDYCNTEIIVEEAVDNLLKVELKDSPTFDNYLKLGNRYFDNKEFEEAYKAYSKAEEINPDNPLVVLRRGLCRTLITDYNVLDIISSINGMRTAYDLMKKMNFSKDEINNCINDTGTVLYITKKYIVDVYNRNKLNKEQTKGYIERLESCLDGYYYLDSIVDGDKDLEKRILSSIIEIIDIILGNSNDAKYHLSSSYVSELKDKRKNCVNRLGTDYKKVETNVSKEKVVEVDGHSTIIWTVLCYVMFVFLFILFLGSIFTSDGILSIGLWFLCMISFLPFIKKYLVGKFGSNVGKVVIIIRTLLFLLAFILFASSPSPFEKTFYLDDVSISFHSGLFELKKDSIISGKYHWDSKDNDYYIYVQTDDNQNLEYRYRENDEGGTLCLLENNKCIETYLPSNS